jgi:hypothetical protein
MGVGQSDPARISIADLWVCNDSETWKKEFERYWSFVRNENMAVEITLDKLQLDRIRAMNEETWYSFLHDEYFPWKYTASNRLATTRKQLKKYKSENALAQLDKIRHQLLALNPDDIRAGLTVACKIRGLGTAGASGLLSLMFPRSFATVDQFVVKALLDVRDLPERENLERMKPENLTINNAVILTEILRQKSAEMNHALKSDFWTPRRLDMVLWTYGRN